MEKKKQVVPKKQGDVVSYVRNGLAVNAIVLMARSIKTPVAAQGEGVTEEHLTLAFFDQSGASAVMSGDQLEKSIAKAFDVLPLSDTRKSGWKDFEPGKDADDDSQIPVAVYSDPKNDAVTLEDAQRKAIDAGLSVHTARYEDGTTVIGAGPLPLVAPSGHIKVSDVEHPESATASTEKDKTSIEEAGLTKADFVKGEAEAEVAPADYSDTSAAATKERAAEAKEKKS